MSVSAQIVIPGIGWFVRLVLEGWTIMYLLIYAGLTGVEPFWVSAAGSGDVIDKGREGTVGVEPDGT